MKQDNIPITPLQQAVLSVLCYFNVFQHPLTLDEIRLNCSIPANNKDVEKVASELLEIGIISNHSGFYFLKDQDATIVQERKVKENRAINELQKSQKYTRLISRFPFVKAVCISGSLSKGVMETDGDVDYFIITEKGRLWICRSLLIAFKKLFLLNSRKYFCTNYFVDTENMVIPDKSIFTATEINYLKPVCNELLVDKMRIENNWTEQFTPNYKRPDCEDCFPESRNGMKRFFEFCMKGNAGEKLDNYFFRLTLKRWKKKFPHFNAEDFDLNMRSRKNVSKHHPRGYQQKVLIAHEQKLREILQTNDVERLKTVAA
ncbi:MAG TPA: nucleotidyltransferase domain-containing protein [Bacteroidia bacterium]